MKNIFSLVLLGGGAYVLYKWYEGQLVIPGLVSNSASSDPITGANTSPNIVTDSGAVLTGAARGASEIAQAIRLASGGATSLNWDQWSYYYQQVTKTTISGSQFGAILAAAGVSSSANATDLNTFMNAVNASQGLNGVTSAQIANSTQHSTIGMRGLSGLGTFEGAGYERYLKDWIN